MTTIYRTLPLIVVLPAGAFIGNKFFIKSKRASFIEKVVFYFLIIISIFGIFENFTGGI